MTEERDNLLADLNRETWNSIVAMPRWAQAVLFAGFAGFLVLGLGDWPEIPHTLLACLRTGAFILLIAGLIENARGFDEFYARVYLYASTFSFILSGLAIYAAYEFGVNLGVRVISVMAGAFCIGFLVAFAYLRRA